MESLFNLPTKPENANECYALAFNSKNIEFLISLYEEKAKLLSNNSEITGKESIKIELQKYIQLDGQMKIKNRFTTQFEDIALLGSTWEIEFKNRQGEITIIKGLGSEVVRQQSDGTWLFIIDNPIGGQ
jgi:ketosteroid isomerase-like protein